MRNAAIGFVAALVLVGIGGAGVVAYTSMNTAPEVTICTHIQDVCEPEKEGAFDSCVEAVGDMMEAAEPEEMARLEECVVTSDGCTRAVGCLAGSGLQQAFGGVGDFFKGLGHSMGIGR